MTDALSFLKAGAYLDKEYPYDGARKDCRISGLTPVMRTGQHT